jgi:tRNA1(Val) A37 N6-methylase TrmN6
MTYQSLIVRHCHFIILILKGSQSKINKKVSIIVIIIINPPYNLDMGLKQSDLKSIAHHSDPPSISCP